jgi:uncharacterized protein (DUF58 family)
MFDKEFLRKLDPHRLKRAFPGQFRAERRSRKMGSGLEFADHRAYVPGDDFRHVDWSAYQRLDKLLLRLFEEEQDLPIYLLIDCSNSMAAGAPSKLEYARQVAAALCYIGLASIASACGVAGDVRELPSQRGRERIFRLWFLDQPAHVVHDLHQPAARARRGRRHLRFPRRGGLRAGPRRAAVLSP